jgi:YidC/Oxa1 family membrane protein insertase
MSVFALLNAAVGAGTTLLHVLATALSPVGGATAAIVVLTVAIRLLLTPLRYAQFRAQRAQADLAPQLRQLTERHRGNPEKLRAETLALYQSTGTSPLSGCLPTLAQAPVLTVLYRLFSNGSLATGSGALPGHHLLGVGLDQTWIAALTHGALFGPALAVGLLFCLLTVLAYWSGKRAARYTEATGPLVRIMPFGTVLFAALAPFAVGIYLAATTGYSMIEETIMRRVVALR